MKAFLSITVLALAALSQSTNGHEWMCQDVPANITTDDMKVFSKCHGELSQQDADVPEDEQKFNKIHEMKSCIWKDEKYMVIDGDGKFDWDKLRTMCGGVFGNGVGEAVADKAKEECESKLEGGKFETNEPKTKEFSRCFMHVYYTECHKKKE